MLVQREKEIKILNDAFLDDDSHFIAIYGEKGLGKTSLIKEAYGDSIAFCHEGLSDGNKKEQLLAFTASLKNSGLEIDEKPKDWLDAFFYLRVLIKQSKENRKIVFIDEISLMDTKRKDILMELDSFWNGFAYLRKDVVLVVCSSDVLWMEANIIHNIGGLYGRVTERIHLEKIDV